MKTGKYSEKRQFGNLGETIACRFLEKKGFRIITRNYLKKWGEIDIVAEKDHVTHFIEVKTVSYETQIRPEENVHSQKLKKLYRTIETYILEHETRDWVLDVVCVYLDPKDKRARIRYIPHIVE